MLVRSMAPQVIAADEIGTKQDAQAIEEAVCSGVKGIFTAHGENKEELIKNPCLKELIEKKFIEKVIFLKANELGRTIKVEEKVC